MATRKDAMQNVSGNLLLNGFSAPASNDIEVRATDELEAPGTDNTAVITEPAKPKRTRKTRKKELKTERLEMRITEDVYNKLDKLASEQGLTISAYVTTILAKHLRENYTE